MSEEAKKQRPGEIAMSWWKSNIAPRDKADLHNKNDLYNGAAARGLSARLRRADSALAVLCEPKVHELARDLHFGPAQAEQLVQLVCLLAEIRGYEAAPLARKLGGDDPVLSPARFEKLIRSEGEALTNLMRRAIRMAEYRCNVAALAGDLIHWNEATRNRWCFHYFDTDAPRDEAQNNSLGRATE
ncbi:type I-E CRISPR-associated protein Cse2/CasB [Pseudochrobactrum sp. HB0163]|uniref:type I-E CRISPR-associated protein Cse2/CasB n=1 Tax=Pseudochrobactrum sp. HB0163 TaxID=3450708 RepID=UPI003F6DAABB